MAYPSPVLNIETRIQNLVTRFPTICARVTLPNRTHEGGTTTTPGRQVSCVRIGTGTGSGRPRILIVGGVHAREWAPPDAVLKFIEKLLAAYDPRRPRAMTYDPTTNSQPRRSFPSVRFKRFSIPASDVQLIVERLELYVIPLANPDGRAFTMAAPSQRGWRKNRRAAPTGLTCLPIPAGVPAAALPWLSADPAGVDLNRNFNIAWDFDVYFSTSASSSPGQEVKNNSQPCMLSLSLAGEVALRQLYRGPSAASEPETQNIAHIITDRHINFYLDVHSAAGKFLYAWGMAPNQTTNTAQSFKNTALDRPAGAGRDPRGSPPAYAEWMPPGRERDHQTLGDSMRDAILDSTGYTRTEATPDPVTHVAPNPEAEEAYHRSTYLTVQSTNLFAPSTAFETGISRDFAFSQQIGSIPGSPIRATALDPVFSFTFECGRDEDGGFQPHATNAYPKVEREVAAGIWRFLSFAATWRAPVPTPPPPTPPPPTPPTPPSEAPLEEDCFIATAVYGSATHPQVQFLRELRDIELKQTAHGRLLMKFTERVYYSFSPTVARFLRRHQLVSFSTRSLVVEPIANLLRRNLKLISDVDSPKRRLVCFLILAALEGLAICGLGSAVMYWILLLLRGF